MPVYPDRDRWLALGLLLLALAVAYALLVHPWWTVPMREAGQRIEELRQRDLRVRTQLRQAPEVQRGLAAARTLAAQQPGFLDESSAELATAGLVKRLEAVVAEASPGNRSCAIQNRSPLPAGTTERFRRVAVNVRLLCGTPQLAAVLHALESGSPRLFVDNLNITAQRFYFTPEQAPTSGGLDVSFDLYGYVSPPAGGAADAR